MFTAIATGLGLALLHLGLGLRTSATRALTIGVAWTAGAVRVAAARASHDPAGAGAVGWWIVERGDVSEAVRGQLGGAAIAGAVLGVAAVVLAGSAAFGPDGERAWRRAGLAAVVAVLAAALTVPVAWAAADLLQVGLAAALVVAWAGAGGCPRNRLAVELGAVAVGVGAGARAVVALIADGRGKMLIEHLDPLGTWAGWVPLAAALLVLDPRRAAALFALGGASGATLRFTVWELAPRLVHFCSG